MDSVGEWMARRSTGVSKLGDDRQERIVDGDHRRRRDAIFEFGSTTVTPLGEQSAEPQLGDGRSCQEELIAAEVLDVRCELDRTPRVERRAEDAVSTTNLTS